MNGWTDLQVDLSELVAAHLVYMNLNSHGHSSNIQCDISTLLKGIENCKSRVVATLIRTKAAILMRLLSREFANYCWNPQIGYESSGLLSKAELLYTYYPHSYILAGLNQMT